MELSWTANSEAYLGGYKIYYGTAPESYRKPVVVGNLTSYRLTGLVNGTDYQIALSSMNSVGVESKKCAAITVEAHTPHLITASAGSGGDISPSGDVTVRHETDQAFTITPDAKHHVLDVWWMEVRLER